QCVANAVGEPQGGVAEQRIGNIGEGMAEHAEAGSEHAVTAVELADEDQTAAHDDRNQCDGAEQCLGMRDHDWSSWIDGRSRILVRVRCAGHDPCLLYQTRCGACRCGRLFGWLVVEVCADAFLRPGKSLDCRQRPDKPLRLATEWGTVMQLRICLLLGCLLWGTQASAQQWQFATEEFPPFTYSRGGKPPGGAVTEMVQAACMHLGHQCRIDVMPWSRALRMGEEGQVDGVFTVILAPEREQAFHITRMLVESRYDIYGPLSSLQRNLQAADLRGRRVGVYGPSGTLLVLQRALQGVADVQIE